MNKVRFKIWVLLDTVSTISVINVEMLIKIKMMMSLSIIKNRCNKYFIFANIISNDIAIKLDTIVSIPVKIDFTIIADSNVLNSRKMLS